MDDTLKLSDSTKVITQSPSLDETESLSTESSPGPAKAIQALNRGDVHRICSGQVVLSLATAVKELVENSIDAGATCIEVRLQEFGSKSIEVVDNGSGVDEANFQSLTLKHHTSKLEDFSDLVNVDTFGFRGEALSSLCALSKVSVVTRHREASVGTKLVYDHNGHLTKQTVQARQVGTTVCVENLFSTLPVRHKEFTRTLKKEFAKMVQVLNAYCIIATGVKLSCTNQMGKGKKNLIVATIGSSQLKDNIINVFGSKQYQTLVEYQPAEADEDACAHYGINLSHDTNKQIFQILGFVSSSEHKLGRSSTDRQFFFINRRPCDPLKISRLVNEVYHQYNRHQYPFVVLDISLTKDAVDVNVTPDKRQVFVQHEKLLLATIKTSLVNMWESSASVYNLNQTVISFSQQNKSSPAAETGTEKKSSTDATRTPIAGLSSSANSKDSNLSSSLSKLKRSFSSAFAKESPEKTPPSDKQRRLDTFMTGRSSSCLLMNSSVKHESINKSPSVSYQLPQEYGTRPSQTNDAACISKSPNTTSVTLDESAEKPCSESLQDTYTVTTLEDCNKPLELSMFPRNDIHIDDVVKQDINVDDDDDDDDDFNNLIEGASNPSLSDAYDEDVPHQQPSSDVQIANSELDTPSDTSKRKEKIVSFSLSQIQQAHSLRNEKQREGCKLKFRSFRAKINPSDNRSAEEELQREIRKESFKDMEVLGQFNLGFIITRLGNDLFIVDQHATDEKYNFEMLQKHTQIHCQKLIQPQRLHLTVANQTVLLDNLTIFQKNGFEFLVKEDDDPSQRVQLTARPVSKTWEFGSDDIEELIFMLSDSPGVLCRPSRIRAMFASRACRKSIMIGTALNHSQMKKVLCHMGEIEQPWNCPHGRPTMRHLINLGMVTCKL